MSQTALTFTPRSFGEANLGYVRDIGESISSHFGLTGTQNCWLSKLISDVVKSGRCRNVAEKKAKASLCYEAIFPTIPQNMSEPNFHLGLSSDAWTHKSSCPMLCRGSSAISANRASLTARRRWRCERTTALKEWLEITSQNNSPELSSISLLQKVAKLVLVLQNHPW